MGEIGFILQEARLKKGFTLDRVADDTNISVRFLDKLENNDFTGFPGEPYIVGFLRNYADFLGLESEEIVGIYKSQTLQASPPLPESTSAEVSSPPSPTKDPRRIPLAGAVAFLILGAALLWVVLGKGLTLGNQEEAVSAPAVYRVEGGPFEKRLYPGDSLLIPLGEEVHRVSLSKIEESIELETPSGFLTLRLGESQPLGTEASPASLVHFTAIDFKQSSPKAGVLIRVDFSSVNSQEPATSEVTIPPSPVPMEVKVSFRANTLFRHEADRKEWVEKYYSKGESLGVNVASSLTIWSSNAQAVKLSFQASGAKSFDLELGGPGEVVVKRISWLRSEGSWVLAATTLD
ncbi:MAG: hypothetical protein FD137_671 [Spirochaetes bacterium]|nr:MAG: hypothetical protein FD137_671 [Spirochaetota bacterium]